MGYLYIYGAVNSRNGKKKLKLLAIRNLKYDYKTADFVKYYFKLK